MIKRTILQERLALLNEARSKISLMGNKNVFTLDIDAMDILIRLSDEFQDLLAENISLRKENKRLEVFGHKKTQGDE
tara:strand:+ start:267 stop:497 length:231 start_codon:yes stop_codon:yes gene_type:complete